MVKGAVVKNIATTTVQRIYEVARESLRLHPKDGEAAVEAMLATLGMNAELDFLAGEVLRKETRYYLAEARGGGHRGPDAQETGAPATSSAGVGDKDQTSDDTQRGSVPSTHATPLSGFAVPLAGADDKGHVVDEAHRDRAQSAPAPRPRQVKHHAVATQTIVKSIFDDFKVTRRQGSREPIGDILMASLSRLAKHNDKRAYVNDRERAVYCQILSWAEKQAHIPKDARVRDVLDVKLLKSFIEAAIEVADARARITYRPEQLHA